MNITNTVENFFNSIITYAKETTAFTETQLRTHKKAWAVFSVILFISFIACRCYFKATKKQGVKPKSINPINQIPSSTAPSQPIVEHRFPKGISMNELNAEQKKGYVGRYEFDVQLEKILQAKREGKTLKLIIGRGNAETNHSELPKDDNTVWVYTSFWPIGLSSEDPKPHLWLNLNNGLHLMWLKRYLNNSFDVIGFDAATWNWIESRTEVIKTFHEILKPGGYLILPALQIQTGEALINTPFQLKGFPVPSLISFGAFATSEDKTNAFKQARNDTLNFLKNMFREVQDSIILEKIPSVFPDPGDDGFFKAIK